MSAELVSDDTVVIGALAEHTVLLPRISTDPVDELVDRVRPQLGQAVDALQVAAALESDGFSDRGARVEYGYADVFALAGEVYRRLGPADPAPYEAKAQRPRTWRDSLRLVSHGPLYALPSAVFPAAMAVVGRHSLILALVLAGGVGWIYSGIAGYAAYRLIGLDRPGAAARVLRRATLGSPLIGFTLGATVVATVGGGPALIVMVVCQLAYQLAGTVLMVYRQEGRQVLAMLPAVAAGVAFLIVGGQWRTWAVELAIASVVLVFVLAVLATGGRGKDGELASRPVLRGERATLIRLGGYALLSATLLLHAEAPYLSGRLDIAVAVAPLILAMGFVEWRADRFRTRAIALTRRARGPRAFVRGVWILLTLEAWACLLVAAALGAVLAGGLWWTGQLSPAGAVMIAAHVSLGAAYYFAFLLAGLKKFGWLSLSILAAVAVHVGTGAWLGVSPLVTSPAAPLADTTLYLGSVLLLQALLVLGLAPVAGQVRHYR